MEQAGVIECNLPASRQTVEQELSLSPRQQRILDAANLRMREVPRSTLALEEAHRLHETMTRRRRASQWQGQERWQGREHEEMRVVNILWPRTWIHRLRQAGVDARDEVPSTFRRGVTGRLWLTDYTVRGRVGVMAWVKDEDSGRMAVRTVTNLQDPGPEWGVVRFDQFNVPTDEKFRGWRSALLHLIRADVLTEEEVNRAFGPVPLNEASEWYREQLQMWRSEKLGLTA